MDSDISKLQKSLQEMPADLQELVKNVVTLISIQNNQIELLQDQLKGFMDIEGPRFKDLVSVYSKAAKNTFNESDAVKTVSDLKEAVNDNNKWIDAVLKSFKFAKEVVTILK